VRLLDCHILGFGRLVNVQVEFRDGLNVIFAANEGGKSTLQRFLMGMLCGQLRADLKTQRRLDSWVERYKPWRSTDYRGILRCRLAGGRELEIHRSFGKEDAGTVVRTSAGEDITRQYGRQRNGDLLFVRDHFGMPKEMFESVAVIGESNATTLGGKDTLRDRIANLAQSGDEALSLGACLAKLQGALDSIGSERAPTKPLRQALDRCRDLHDEQEALADRRAEFQSWIREKARLAEEVGRLERELTGSRGIVAAARWKETSLRVRNLEDLDGELIAIRQEIEDLGGIPDFPIHRLDELNRLEWGITSFSKRLGEIRLDKQSALSQIGQVDQELQKLAHYVDLSTSVETEKITEWFVGFLSLARQRENVQQVLVALQDESDALQTSLQRYAPQVRETGMDWDGKARETAERERATAQESLTLAENLTRERTQRAEARTRAVRSTTIGIAALLPAITGCAGSLILLRPGAAAMTGVGFSGILAVMGILFLVSGYRSRQYVRDNQERIVGLEEKQLQLRILIEEAYRDINQATADSGYEKMEEFLSATREAGQIKQRHADLSERILRAEREKESIAEESDTVYGKLSATLSKVGLSCSPAILEEQVDILRQKLRKTGGLNASRQNLARQAESLQIEEEDTAKERNQAETGMREILAAVELDSSEAFKEACRLSLQVQRLRERESARSREFRRLCSGISLEEWQEQLRGLENQKSAADAELAEDVDPQAVPTLPYLPSVEEAEAEERRLKDLSAQSREELARLVERVKQAFHNYRSAAVIEEDLAVTERESNRLNHNREALTIALETIVNLSREQQEVSAPQLNRAVESRFLRLCRERYEEVKIDPDFEIWVRESSGEMLRSAENLSRGTQDQLYLALRFGLLDLLSSVEEPCPSFLDEPFAAYDWDRISEVFKILSAEASARQLLLFTCREDVRSLALEHGGHEIRL